MLYTIALALILTSLVLSLSLYFFVVRPRLSTLPNKPTQPSPSSLALPLPPTVSAAPPCPQTSALLSLLMDPSPSEESVLECIKLKGPFLNLATQQSTHPVGTDTETMENTAPLKASALSFASFHGFDRVVSTLLGMGANPNIPDGGGVEATPLHWAARGGHATLCDALLKHKASVNATDRCKETPCHYAASRGMRGALEVLRVWGANEGAVSALGTTPASLACRRLEVLQQQHSASSASAPTSLGRTPKGGLKGQVLLFSSPHGASSSSPPPSLPPPPSFVMPKNAKGTFDFGPKIKGSLREWRQANPLALVANVSGRGVLSEEDLGHLAGVCGLDISGCDLRGVGPHAFNAFQQQASASASTSTSGTATRCGLHTLDVFRCKGVVDEHLVSVRGSLQSLQISGFDQPGITGVGVSALKAMSHSSRSLLLRLLSVPPAIKGMGVSATTTGAPSSGLSGGSPREKGGKASSSSPVLPPLAD